MSLISVCTLPLPHFVYCAFPSHFQSFHSDFQLFSDFAPLGGCCCFPGLPSLVRGMTFPGKQNGKSTGALADSGAANAALSVWWYLPMHIFIRWGPGGKTDSQGSLSPFSLCSLTWPSNWAIMIQPPLLKAALFASRESC